MMNDSFSMQCLMKLFRGQQV